LNPTSNPARDKFPYHSIARAFRNSFVQKALHLRFDRFKHSIDFGGIGCMKELKLCLLNRGLSVKGRWLGFVEEIVIEARFLSRSSSNGFIGPESRDSM
jgi:hypothetical protein